MIRKIIIYLITLLCANTFLLAQGSKGIQFENGSFHEILTRAQKDKKGPQLVFLDCYTSWCGPCKQMANQVFTQPEVGNYFNKHFVNIKIDMEKGEGPALAKKYAVSGFPTFLILTLDGEEIDRIVGAKEPKQFIEAVEKAKEVKNSPLALRRAFEKSKTPLDASLYLNTLYNMYQYQKGQTFLEEYLSVFEPKDVFGGHLWFYVYTSLGNSKPLRNYLAAHKEVANGILGKEMADQALTYGYTDALAAYLGGKLELSKAEVVQMAQDAHLLMGPQDNYSALCTKIALLHTDADMAGIEKLYDFDRLKEYPLSDVNLLERLFATLPGISKERICAYYDAKEEYHKKVTENCKKWKEAYTREM